VKYIGLDLGTRTLGISLSDPLGMIATSYTIIRHDEDYESLVPTVKKIVEEEHVDEIVLGLPKNMNNSNGFATERSLNFKALLETKTDIPIYLLDERLSTIEAENILLSADMSRKRRKKVIDGVAAQIILETFMKKEGL